MQRPISVAALTAVELTPPQMIRAAAEAGYTHSGIRLVVGAPLEWTNPMNIGGPMFRETQAALRDTGITLLDFDTMRLDAGTDPQVYAPVLDVAAALGVEYGLVACDDPDEARTTDKFGALCDLAAARGMKVMLEFMPWTGVRTIGKALRIIEAAGRENGRILVDVIHVDRGGDTAADIASIPPHLHSFFQICDLPAERPVDTETMLFQARKERLPAGEGGIDVAAMLRAIPRDLIISVEIPQEQLSKTMPVVERLKMLRDKTFDYVDRALADGGSKA